MHAITAHLLQSLGTTVVEMTVKAFVGKVFAPGTPEPPPPQDPAEGAAAAMDAFLRAIAHHDMERFTELCDPDWALQPETSALMDHTLASAPPVSWSIDELYAPDGWRPGRPLPWVIAELPVTFAVADGWQDVPTVLRAVRNRSGWQIDHLAWGHPAVPQPQPEYVFSNLGDLFQFPTITFQEESPAPGPAVIACPCCNQKLRVPTDRGRLRVSCPRCRNVQWYTP